MRLIGHRWKCGNVCRLMILIGRGLDLKEQFERVCWKFHGQLPVQFSRCDKREKTSKSHTISGDYSLRDPPVPIPNTEVKPQHADGTWLETARESRTSPDSRRKRGRTEVLSRNRYSSVAQWQSTRLLTELL